MNIYSTAFYKFFLIKQINLSQTQYLWIDFDLKNMAGEQLNLG